MCSPWPTPGRSYDCCLPDAVTIAVPISVPSKMKWTVLVSAPTGVYVYWMSLFAAYVVEVEKLLDIVRE